jgi:TRAP-type transport system periplasmic protein
MSRRSLPHGLMMMIVMIVALTFATAASAQVTWKMATKMPPTSPEGKGFQMFADLVKSKSNGKMVISIFPAEQLGKTDATLELLQSGVVQVYPEGSPYLAKYVPEFSYAALPFVFTSFEHWAKWMDSPIMAGWLEKVAKEDNIMILGKESDFIRGPYRVMVSKKPVVKLDDLKGLKLRMYPDDLAIAVWKHLGTNPIILAWTEVYESLGRGVIDACNSPMALVESMKFYEQAKYIIRHDEFPQGVSFMTNNKQFQALSPDLKKAVLEAHKEACDFSVRTMNEEAAKSLERMKAKGVAFSEIDRKPIEDSLMPLYKQWESEGKMPKGFLESIAKAKAQ